MAHGRFIHEYQKGAVNGASPLQLVVMLYDGALRFMEAGKHALIARDLDKQNHNLQKAQKIVMELMACLDMQQGGDIAKNLMALYTYVLDQLVEANTKDSADAVDRALKVISELRESWVEIEKQLRPQAEQQDLAA